MKRSDNYTINANLRSKFVSPFLVRQATVVSSEDEDDCMVFSPVLYKNERYSRLPDSIQKLRRAKRIYLENIEKSNEDLKQLTKDGEIVGNGHLQMKRKKKINKDKKSRRQARKKQKLIQDSDAITTANKNTVVEALTKTIASPEKSPQPAADDHESDNARECSPIVKNEIITDSVNHQLHRELKPNQHSYCQLLTEDTVVMVVKHPGVLCLKGKILLKSIKGCVEILGWHIKQGSEFEEIYQTGKDALLIETMKPPCCGVTDNPEIVHSLISVGCPQHLAESITSNLVSDDVVVVCKKLVNHAWSHVAKYFPTLFKPLDPAGRFLEWDCEFIEMDKYYCVRISNEMASLAQDIAEKCADSSNSQPRIIVCGGKYLGKSTLLKYLVNSTLTVSKEVCYLDCDPGQSTFTAPGMVSLVVLSKPFFGPPFVSRRKTYMSHLVGDHSVVNAPSHYGACVQSLFNLYQKDPDLRKLPLFVNTMGWVEGIGLALLCNNIATVNPSHVVQLNTKVFTKRNASSLTPEYVTACAHWESCEPLSYKWVQILSQVNSIDIYLTAAMSRCINMIAHFADAQPKPDEVVPLRKCKTYRVPWSTVAVYACGAVVANCDIMYVLNGTMVALCKCNKEDATESGFGYPQFLRSMPICECFGYGFIRGIDIMEKFFYVITALPPDTLAHVNCIIKGHLSIPPIMIYEKPSELLALPYYQRVQETENAKFGIGLRTLKPKYVKKRIVRKQRV